MYNKEDDPIDDWTEALRYYDIDKNCSIVQGARRKPSPRGTDGLFNENDEASWLRRDGYDK